MQGGKQGSARNRRVRLPGVGGETIGREAISKRSYANSTTKARRRRRRQLPNEICRAIDTTVEVWKSRGALKEFLSDSDIEGISMRQDLE